MAAFIQGLYWDHGAVLFFYGVTTIGLPESITYQQSYPIFGIDFFVLVGATIELSGVDGHHGGFLGLCLIFVPKMSSHALEVKSHLIGIANLLMTGMAYLSIRGLTKYYDNRTIVLSFMLCGIAFPILSMLLSTVYKGQTLDFIIAPPVVPQWADLPLILCLGIAALLGQVFSTNAFSHRNTGLIGAVGYSNIVFSIFLGS